MNTVYAPDSGLAEVFDHSWLEVTLSFYKPLGISCPVIRAPWFRIVGNCVRQGPDDEKVGVLQNGTWEIQGDHFTSFDIKGAATIRLEDAASGESAAFGPFAAMRMANFIMWTNAEPFAKFNNQTQLWEHVKTLHYWPVMIVEAARAI